MSLLHASPEDVERFMRYVDKLPNGCWFWTGARSRGKGNRKWYGSFRLGKRTVRAHRFASEVFNRETCPPGHHRDHLCSFSMCVNPAHIEVVTREVNQQRKSRQPQELGRGDNFSQEIQQKGFVFCITLIHDQATVGGDAPAPSKRKGAEP